MEIVPWPHAAAESTGITSPAANGTDEKAANGTDEKAAIKFTFTLTVSRKLVI